MNPIGEPFVQLIEVESSNNYAMAQVQARLAEHGAAWFVHHQTKGKGQRGKSWEMEPGQNIILSTVIEPVGLKHSDMFILSAAVAVACHDLFSKYALDETKIKWPNDIYWQDRKAGGILIENIFKGSNWKFAIAGMGININQVVFPPVLTKAVSLKQITGKTFDCVTLAKELCTKLENRWQQLQSGNYLNILQDYNLNLYKLNQKAVFKKAGATFKATVTGVNSKGELLLNNGTEQAIRHGEWEWVIE